MDATYLLRSIYYFKLSRVYSEPYESRYLAESWYWLFIAASGESEGELE